ncbi:TPA: hypothetical protein ACHU8X_002620 [Enterococcus faecalis]
MRKEYDHWQIEIGEIKEIFVDYIDCECGNLVKRSLREKKEFGWSELWQNVHTKVWWKLCRAGKGEMICYQKPAK